MKPEVVDAPDDIELTDVKGSIEFRHVWFAYSDENWVLKDVSFKVNAGDNVAFVGSTGSGKTTILSLLCRNYDIQKGEILLDGINIRKIKLASLRRCFGQMLQDVFLFSGTIRSNILLRMDGVSDEEINEACRYVNADKFINRLRDGLDEEVRERGNNFSAGQRQLLSFARTIIHKPKIMILDEATASLDTETEKQIQDAINALIDGITTIAIAHRLSTLRNATKLVVLEKGGVEEVGTHDQLMRSNGRYYKLVMAQRQMSKMKK